ncbi:MAG: ankyrin repeat domain-containing protein [Gammaproteobacteria bacterium]|nr:ankyrin repeat domain-containing protein [Gammaproteobacteria bacterium]MCW5584319.1 ankyrin repeat domain-containing protein [Gammaproteobacteria bacterium]
MSHTRRAKKGQKNPTDRLIQAIRKQDIEEIQQSIKAGADLAEKRDVKESNRQLTPIQLAVILKHWNCVEAIVLGSPLKYSRNKKDEKDSHAYGSALYFIIKDQQLDLANKFFNAEISFSLDWRDTATGNNVLHEAVTLNQSDILKLLLQHGSSVNWEHHWHKKNRDNKTPVELASDLKHWNCVQVFLEMTPSIERNRYPHYENVLLNAIKAKNYAIVKLLLEKNIPCNKFNQEHGNVALSAALGVDQTSIEIVKLLLKHGVDYNARNNAAEMAADVAERLGYFSCAKILKDYAKKENNEEQLKALSKKLQHEITSKTWKIPGLWGIGWVSVKSGEPSTPKPIQQIQKKLWVLDVTSDKIVLYKEIEKILAEAFQDTTAHHTTIEFYQKWLSILRSDRIFSFDMDQSACVQQGAVMNTANMQPVYYATIPEVPVVDGYIATQYPSDSPYVVLAPVEGQHVYYVPLEGVTVNDNNVCALEGAGDYFPLAQLANDPSLAVSTLPPPPSLTPVYQRIYSPEEVYGESSRSTSARKSAARPASLSASSSTTFFGSTGKSQGKAESLHAWEWSRTFNKL